MVKKAMVCSTCGSTDVLCDAYAEWDFEAQKWVLQNTFDKGAYCQGKCNGECTIDEIDVSEPPSETEVSVPWVP